MIPLELASDCSRCFGLCCVLLPFRAAAGFGADKDAGVACGHLRDDDRCGIHGELRERGWPGCTVFECFGAGQQVSQVVYAGRSWRDQGELADMSAVLAVVRALHEMLALLAEVERRAPTDAAAALAARIAALASGGPDEVLAVDVDALRGEVSPVLRATSERVRRGGPDHAGRDLSGRDLRAVPLRDACLRGTLLLGADLRGADLARTDLLGADLRGADLRGADLTEALFLTQPQANAARGDAGTRLPPSVRTPGHWA